MAGGVFTFKMEGLKETLNSLDKLGIDIKKATAAAVFSTAQAIAHKADELVPVDTGVLRATQDVSRQKSLTQKDYRSVISYGGPSAPYALAQHEELDWWHPPKPPGKSKVGKRSGKGPVAPGTGRGPKYLEHPFLEETANWPASIVARIRAESTWV